MNLSIRQRIEFIVAMLRQWEDDNERTECKETAALHEALSILADLGKENNADQRIK